MYISTSKPFTAPTRSKQSSIHALKSSSLDYRRTTSQPAIHQKLVTKSNPETIRNEWRKGDRRREIDLDSVKWMTNNDSCNSGQHTGDVLLVTRPETRTFPHLSILMNSSRDSKSGNESTRNRIGQYHLLDSVSWRVGSTGGAGG